MQRIENLLRKEIGLDAGSIGPSAIGRTVRLRMKNLGLNSVADYARLLHSSRSELDTLIEAVVVIETWFFRDRDLFSAFVALAIEWLEQHPADTLRVLSVPCSTGEEAYSLAMALLDANAPPNRFIINAVDVSANALVRARKGVYEKNSFRGQELAFRDRHFQGAPDGHVLNPRVGECVQFLRDNVLSEKFLLGHTPYDFIFCRNLLIYFDRDTQVRTLEKLHRLLSPKGVLFLAPAELPIVLRSSFPSASLTGSSLAEGGEDHKTPTHNGFVNAHLTKAFACRKAPAALAGSGALRETLSPNTESIPRNDAPTALKQNEVGNLSLTCAWTTTETLPKTEDQPRRQSTVKMIPEMSSDLDAARQLADAGNLEEAAMVCQAHLHNQGPSAQAYYLLGLVRDASGDPQAVEYYRKALYLEPNHYETLLQMSLLLEKTGDPAGARIFKQRASRIARKQTI